MEESFAIGRIQLERRGKLTDCSSIGCLAEAALQVADGTHANACALR
jgi:hypothetical protein